MAKRKDETVAIPIRALCELFALLVREERLDEMGAGTAHVVMNRKLLLSMLRAAGWVMLHNDGLVMLICPKENAERLRQELYGKYGMGIPLEIVK